MASTKNTQYLGYVRNNRGKFFLQIPDPSSRWGFHLADGDQTWDGGIGAGSGWTIVTLDTVPDHVRTECDWILDDIDREDSHD